MLVAGGGEDEHLADNGDFFSSGLLLFPCPFVCARVIWRSMPFSRGIPPTHREEQVLRGIRSFP